MFVTENLHEKIGFIVFCSNSTDEKTENQSGGGGGQIEKNYRTSAKTWEFF